MPKKFANFSLDKARLTKGLPSPITWTVSFWAKFNATTAVYKPLFNRCNRSSAPFLFWGTNNNATLTHYFDNGLCSAGNDANATGRTFVVGMWYFFTLSYNDPTGICYVNAVPDITVSHTGANSVLSDALSFGMDDDSDGECGLCSMCAVNIWNRALTPDEIAEQMGFARAVNRDELVWEAPWEDGQTPYAEQGAWDVFAFTSGGTDPDFPFGVDFGVPPQKKRAAKLGISFDAATNSGYQAAASTYSWSHTCTGSNRFLAVDVSLLSAGQTVTGITYNGVALSLIASQSTITSFGRVECWGLANPASGANTIAVTLSGAIASTGTAVSYANVHQASPTEGGAGNQATNTGSATDATVPITSVADQCWIHAAVATDDGSVTAGQTTRNNVTGVGGSGADEDFGPQSPGAKTMSYTGLGIVSTWAIAGYAIRPTTASSLAGIFNPYYYRLLAGGSC